MMSTESIQAIDEKKDNRPTSCIICGKPIKQPTGPGQPRKYCGSWSCINRARRRRQATEMREMQKKLEAAERLLEAIAAGAG